MTGIKLYSRLPKLYFIYLFIYHINLCGEFKHVMTGVANVMSCGYVVFRTLSYLIVCQQRVHVMTFYAVAQAFCFSVSTTLMWMLRK